MCAPVALVVASMAISAMSAMAQQKQQADAAKAQEASIQHNAEVNNDQLRNQYQQQNQQAMQDQSKYAVQAMQEMGRIDAISAESGLQGVTDERIKDEADNAAADNMATIEANRLRGNEQGHNQGMSMQSQAQAQMSSIKRPSSVGAGLQIAGAAVDMYSKYQGTQPPAPQK